MSACSAAANSVPVRPKPVAISSSTSGTPCSSQRSRRSCDAFGRVEAHPARALHDRLDDHAREACASRTARVTSSRPLGRPLGQRREDVLRQRALPHRVHPAVGVAHRHRAERVAVVAAAPGQQRAPLAVPVLQDQLDRDLDGDGAGVREEHVVEPGPVREPLREPDRGLVREPAEHHVRHAAELVADRLVDDRVPVAVDRAPPGRHPVDQLAPVGERQPDALRGDDRQAAARPRASARTGATRECDPAPAARPTTWA